MAKMRKTSTGLLNPRLADIPQSPAYLVFHDAFDNGAMEVWSAESLALAERIAAHNQERIEALGHEECGRWKAYEKLPRVRVWKYYINKPVAGDSDA